MNHISLKFIKIMDHIMECDSLENFSYNFFLEYLKLISNNINDNESKNKFDYCVKVFQNNYRDFVFINAELHKYKDVYRNSDIFSKYYPCLQNENFKKAIADYNIN